MNKRIRKKVPKIYPLPKRQLTIAPKFRMRILDDKTLVFYREPGTSDLEFATFDFAKAAFDLDEQEDK